MIEFHIYTYISNESPWFSTQSRTLPGSSRPPSRARHDPCPGAGRVHGATDGDPKWVVFRMEIWLISGLYMDNLWIIYG